MATTSVTVTAAVLSVEEVTDGVKNLSDADLLRIKKASQYLSYAGARAPQELRQEAFRRAIDGTRKCPRHVGVAQFLVGAMRSIASSDRKAAFRKPALSIVSKDGSGSILECKDPRLSPEDDMMNREAVAEVRAAVCMLFEGDDIAQTIVDGMIEGMEGQELRELVGLSDQDFATKRRFVRRRIDKAFPNGWIR
jgi:hypothetical protein